MMKHLIFTLVFLSIISISLHLPNTVHGAEAVCTTSYGQGVVCGEKTDEPFIAPAGLKEDLRLIGSGLLALSASAFYLSKRRQSRFIDELLA